MKSVSLASDDHLRSTRKPGILDEFARRMVFKQLRCMEVGSLSLVEGERSFTFGETEQAAELSAKIEVIDGAFYSDIAFGGSVGAGEAYMRGAWQCDDLVSLVRILLRNRDVLDNMETGTAWLTRSLQRLFHWLNRNTREGARRNISAHYDLGNDFFSLWLDESMMYSSAMFEYEGQSLADAQRHRLDVVCEKLGLGPDDHVIEIGTGWGGFAIHAAKKYGCRVTTTTISRQQYEMAWQRVNEAGLQGKIELLLEDYRDLEGSFDKLVSIEMIEAIGSDQYDTYFSQCSRLLKPGGRMLIQAITIADDQYAYAQRNVDFIQRYIFPGSCLPSLAVMKETIMKVSNMQVKDVEDIGRDYALTLNHWRRNFFTHINEVMELGYPDEFIWMWEYYLCYCEGGFLEQAISDVHLLAEKPL
ncbi:MAG: cyclopropane-fatty-acyl-phospholipid synthase family protein [Xanthomonadales bacterium]|nr:cyclopropane-fatty-acyl-phospholipid synthase family protein [Xanthomonadales bacterium]MDH4019756.1 cyclopropane-fatty-acyl-phospholipid synthase family protein [Xanthomonadales bacterium]